MEIYVITHKNFSPKYIDKIRAILLVGANSNHVDVCDYKDNEGSENISNKNSSFCELTGLYWIWKNSKQDIVGLEHYRRYFTNSGLNFIRKPLSKKKIDVILSTYDMIVPKKRDFDGYSCKEQFAKWHKIEVWDKSYNMLKKKYPKYVKYFEMFENSKEGYGYNMFIAPKKIIDTYCEWLFDILFELELNVDLSQYDKYNQRMWGFLSERLFNVWILANDIKVYETSIMFIEENSWYNKCKKKISKIAKR